MCFEDKLREMVRVSRAIPGIQTGWEEIRSAEEQHAQVGRLFNEILYEVLSILEE
jgi:hypothetical protein